MISLFIMYSPDRYEALVNTLSCLEEMDLYDQCQKLLICDVKTNIHPEGWEVIKVPRINGKFCWGRMWDAGVYSSMYEKIIYLDSDRLLPKNFLLKCNDLIEDDVFVFTSRHFMLTRKIPIELSKEMLKCPSMNELFLNEEFVGAFNYEERKGAPFHGSSKNVMSGSTAFTKKTYARLKGVDYWYCGHGAFADNDFHLHASLNGCRFVDTELLELHYPHEKIDENSNIASREILWKMALDNFIYYCHKWSLPSSLTEDYALRLGIKKPSIYIKERIKEFSKES